MFVIEEMTGQEINPDELINIAIENGWYDTNDSGTAALNMDKLLEYYGIESDMSFHNDLDDIAEALASGDKVIVSVDADEYWSGETDDAFTPNDGANHAVEVVGIVTEDGEKKLIVGILNIDEKTQREMEYQEKLFAAESKANLDELTGVKNKHAYADTVKKMNSLLASAQYPPFAVAVFDINNLKQINDTKGHQAGDRYIIRGCNTICRFFKHSPVFRIGGDEFVAIVTGYDYLNIESIMTRFKKHNRKNQKKGDVVIAAGVSRYQNDRNVSPVFKRADAEMYINKRQLKEADA